MRYYKITLSDDFIKKGEFVESDTRSGLSMLARHNPGWFILAVACLQDQMRKVVLPQKRQEII